eukprot:gene20156-26169_t
MTVCVGLRLMTYFLRVYGVSPYHG